MLWSHVWVAPERVTCTLAHVHHPAGVNGRKATPIRGVALLAWISLVACLSLAPLIDIRLSISQVRTSCSDVPCDAAAQSQAMCSCG